MDPGTITFGVLSTVLGISGYGAVKATANQDEELQRQVNMRIKDAVAATESKLKMAEEARKRSEAEVARITAELEVLRSAKSTSPDPTVPEPTVPKPTVPEPTPEPTPEPPLQPIPEPVLEGQSEPEPEAKMRPDQPDEKIMRDDECKNVLDGLEIKSRRDFKKWARTNHPDKGGDSALFQRVNECVLRIFPTGGLRKKKLRTRRHVKQNVRRSRSSKNRPDGAY
jgi:outer membrane biosynthesis protein TonB